MRSDTERSWPRMTCSSWAAMVVALFGVAVRASDYFSRRSLWTDEAALAVNFRRPLYTLLFRRLAHHQTAPPGFLLSEWLAQRLLGEHELALRLVPFLASLATLFVVWWLARRVSGAWPAVAALAVVALNNRMIYYATEIKQYATDALLVTLAYALAFWATEKGQLQRGRVPALVLFGVAAIFSSNASLFALASIVLALFLVALRRRDGEGLRNGIWLGLIWLGALAIYVLVFMANTNLGEGAYLTEYWAARDAFMPWPPDSWLSSAEWLLGRLADIAQDPFDLAHWTLLIIPAASGALSLAREQRWLAAALVMPALLLPLVSAFQLYPLSGRLMLFTVPLFALLVGQAVAWVSRAHRLAGPCLAAAITVMLVAPWAITAAKQLSSPRTKEELRSALLHVASHWQEGDRMYLYYGAKDTFEFYQPHFGFDQDEIVIGNRWRDEPTKYLDDLASLPAGQRVWLVYSHIHRQDGQREHETIRALLQESGSLLMERHDLPGAAVDLAVLK